MTKDQLEKALFLQDLIKVTEENLVKIEQWINESKENVGGHQEYNDKNYCLRIGKHSDGSGMNLNLSRYFGNTEILEAVKSIPEKQLVQFKKDFDEI